MQERAAGMFLVGGTPFSGTTLLTLMLNQGSLVCLDEPDFHNPEQAHRGIPVLRERFPQARFPDPPSSSLSTEQAVDFIEACQYALPAFRLGIKTCSWTFIEYMEAYKNRGLPVVLIVRDIRDVMCRKLPDWEDEASMNREFRAVWGHRHLADLVFRYEDMVRDTESVFDDISRVLGTRVDPKSTWGEEDTSVHYYKSARHDLIRSGRISDERIGVHRKGEVILDPRTMETAAMMGYTS